MNIPIIKLEIQGMKHTIMHAMTQYMAQMDAEVQAAIERACKPEVISSLIEETCREEIAKAIKTEVERFYRYGDGYLAIHDAVVNSLKKGD